MIEPTPVADQVIAALRRINRAIDLHSRLLLQRHGLTAPQLATMQAIRRMPGIRVGRIAEAIHVSQATVTGILDRLESRGLVTRGRAGGDRRQVAIELTDEGRRVTDAAPSIVKDRFRQELAQLPDWEQTQMLATLQRIAAMMHADELDGVPPASAAVMPAGRPQSEGRLQPEDCAGDRPSRGSGSSPGNRRSRAESY